MNLGLYSYLGAAVAYGFFTLLMLFSWRGSLQGKLLTVVITVSTLWAALAAEVAASGTEHTVAYQAFEVVRYMAWYVFLLKLFDTAVGQGSGYRRFIHWALPLSLGFAGLVLANEIWPVAETVVFGITGHILLALIGLAIVEQLFRNTDVKHRWAIKYLFIAVGGIFAFDFYLYAEALLFRSIDQSVWEARGIVNLVAVPLLAVSAVRSKSWSLNIFVSRDIVLNTTAIVGGGLYLLVMSGAGYYLREYGGNWGRIGQVLFFSLAVVLLVSVLSSAHLRARIKVFLAKHFYKNKYDYRIEWLRLTEELSDNAQNEARYKAVIVALAQIVEARAGLLWLRDEQAQYKNVATWQVKRIDTVEPGDRLLVRYFKNTGFIINVNELDLRPEEYEGLVLPKWLSGVQQPWLFVPLQGLESLIGFVVLSNPLVARSINWEDRDLLLTAAKQVSSYLTVLMTSDALAEAKQFEVFTRLSAYMVHDLKNIASELEMVSLNSEKHRSKPEFIEDAFETVEHAAGDIKKLLEQLRNKHAEVEKKIIIDLGDLVCEVVDSKKGEFPQPRLTTAREKFFVAAEKNRLANVLAHLIDNAQQATADDGSIDVTVLSNETEHIVEIKDTGHGMDAEFIRYRLFKPFDTTKGNAGMGIGMYESREFAQQLGGDIHVLSEAGKGSTIALHLPSSAETERAGT